MLPVPATPRSPSPCRNRASRRAPSSSSRPPSRPAAPAAQSFTSNTTAIPTGSPLNDSWTENVDFADCDHDGDWDAAFPDGGDFGNDQNRLWINQAGLQGGTIGFFADESSTRLPVVKDTSRDLEFVDLDGDGDRDLHVTDSSAISNQACRFWMNSGGAQGGTLGFFVDETSTRWLEVGQNDGATTFSSVPVTLALGSGGFVDWACDTTFADLDADGDLDLIQASYGLLANEKGPSRIFLNDADGFFTEYNPSGHQFTSTSIQAGDPTIWAEGVYENKTTDTTGQFADIAGLSISVDVGDLDGDFDLDIVLGDKHDETRLFRNNADGGPLTPFRDYSHAWFQPGWHPGGGAYEQELGDLDGDGSLDLYGLNFGDMICDFVFMGNGDGTFQTHIVQAGSCDRNNEPDFVDFDGDGDLDVICAADSGQEQLFVNQGHAMGGALVLAPSEIPSDTTNSLGVDPCDVDGDGDFDLIIANDLGDANVLLENTTQVADSWAPTFPALEQVTDRATSTTPTRVRVHVLDNEAWTLTSFDDVQLEASIDGGPYFLTSPMRWSGGQVFQGEIPGQLAGTISYRVRATDGQGNTAVSAPKSFAASSACTPPISVYCAAQQNSAGCVPQIGWSGFPSANAGSGFVVTASLIASGNNGILFYSKSGPNNVPFLGGTLCVLPPTRRTPGQASGGTGGCTGTFSIDFNDFALNGSDAGLVSGQGVWAQYWSRDPADPSGTNLTDAVGFTLCD